MIITSNLRISSTGTSSNTIFITNSGFSFKIQSAITVTFDNVQYQGAFGGITVTGGGIVTFNNCVFHSILNGAVVATNSCK